DRAVEQRADARGSGEGDAAADAAKLARRQPAGAGRENRSRRDRAGFARTLIDLGFAAIAIEKDARKSPKRRTISASCAAAVATPARDRVDGVFVRRFPINPANDRKDLPARRDREPYREALGPSRRLPRRPSRTTQCEAVHHRDPATE